MGLDMYLIRKTIFNNQDEIRNLNLPDFINSSNVRDIREEVGYWRKANMIHDWFERNFSDEGLDNCRPIGIETENLEELLEITRNLLESKSEEKAKEILPCAEGFFFGSQEYDEHYWNQLDYTAELLSDILEEHSKIDEDKYRISYEYVAWW